MPRGYFKKTISINYEKIDTLLPIIFFSMLLLGLSYKIVKTYKNEDKTYPLSKESKKDLSMIKVKQKISGTFTSFTGTELFCRIKSFIATLKNNSLSVFDGLQNFYAFQPMKLFRWRGTE